MWTSPPGQRLCSAVVGELPVCPVEADQEVTGASLTSISAACIWKFLPPPSGSSFVRPACGFQLQRLPDQASAGFASAVSKVGVSGLMIGRSREENASVRAHYSDACTVRRRSKVALELKTAT
jgi:hypothetical protein